MGKAVIISEAGDGQYTISTSFDTTAAEVTLAKLQAILAGVQAEIDGGADDVRLILLNARKTALSKQIARISRAAGMTREMSAWCADLTTGLTGEVGTIEIGTEAANGVNIKPGYGGGQAYSPAGDGIETPFLTLPVSTAIMNFAVLPGIQKWRPTYRYGIVSNIDKVADTATVTVSACHSSIQNLDINQASVLNDVPVEYMACNAAAFEDGDAVIVKFEGFAQASPKVVGFKDHPRACAGYNIKLVSLNGAAFPIGINQQYQLRLTQPIPQTVDGGSVKGVYTEDFTVIGGGSLDWAGVVSITVEPGVEIDPDQPLHVSIENAYKWQYLTTDWKGNCPDRGIMFSTGGRAPWVTRPITDLDQYDYLVDIVQWINTGIDLRLEDQSVFQNYAGETLTGYEVAVTGIKVLMRDHAYWLVSDLICAFYVGDDPQYPTNEVSHKYDIVPIVDYRFSFPTLWTYKIAYLAPMMDFGCWGSIGTADCYGVSGAAARYYTSPTIGVPGVYAVNSPSIMSDRAGQNILYNPSSMELSLVADYKCWWIFTEYVLASTDPLKFCDPGDSPTTGGFCGDYVMETGEAMYYEMVDLPGDKL